MDTPPSDPRQQQTPPMPSSQPMPPSAWPPSPPPDWVPAPPWQPGAPPDWAPAQPQYAPVWANTPPPLAPARTGFWRTDAGLTTIIAAAITVVSILVAVAAWRGSSAVGLASDLDGSYIQQVAMRQQELETITGYVELDTRLLPRYQEHVLAAAQLQAAADKLPAGSADRQLLEVRAQGERAIARVMRPFFIALPAVDAQGIATYDRESILRALEDQDTRLADLQPDRVAADAALTHDQANGFVVVGVILAVGLVLLTIAQVLRGRRRIPFAVSGAVAGLAGGIGLVLVEAVLFHGS